MAISRSNNPNDFIINILSLSLLTKPKHYVTMDSGYISNSEFFFIKYNATFAKG